MQATSDPTNARPLLLGVVIKQFVLLGRTQQTLATPPANGTTPIHEHSPGGSPPSDVM
jgi:hypothetical protein